MLPRRHNHRLSNLLIARTSGRINLPDYRWICLYLDLVPLKLLSKLLHSEELETFYPQHIGQRVNSGVHQMCVTIIYPSIQQTLVFRLAVTDKPLSVVITGQSESSE
jgi:hypothetical protein